MASTGPLLAGTLGSQPARKHRWHKENRKRELGDGAPRRRMVARMRTLVDVSQMERYCSKREIADHYGLSLRTIERWQFDGCPSRLIGGVRRFRVSEVEQWLAMREEA